MTGWWKLGIFVVAALVVGANSYKNWWHHCPWVKCEPSCRKVIGGDGCYKCECKPLCTPPKCGPGCEVQKVFDGPCPGCECKDIHEEVPLERICEPVKCGAPCKEVKPETPGDCPKCECDDDDFKADDIICDPPKCPPGCTVEKVYDGPCPGCDCKYEGGEEDEEVKEDEEDEVKEYDEDEVKEDEVKEDEEDEVKEYDEDEVKEYEELKEEEENEEGKEDEGEIEDEDYKGEEPELICDPPICPEGCSIERVFEGPCPGCECIDTELMKPRRVVPCSPPKCPPGCFVQKEFVGLCPECECPKDDIEDKKCPDLGKECDGPGCKLEKDENGCDICKCAPQCTPPKCPRWCKIKDVEDGCPICECPKYRGGWKHKRD